MSYARLCTLSIVRLCLTEILWLHWWSKSRRLRYQVVRSWWGSSYTPESLVRLGIGCLSLL